jgi:glycosyltransferase involved in cell wall biosynthesis
MPGTQVATTSNLDSIVDSIIETDSVLGALRLLSPLIGTAAEAYPEVSVATLSRLLDRHPDDPLAAYMAVVALAGVRSSRADSILSSLLAREDTVISQYAAWSFSQRRPYRPALPWLERLAAEGGFSKMMAELALQAWMRQTPELVWQLRRSRTEHFLRMGERPSPTNTPPRRGSGLRIAQVLMQGRVDGELSAAGAGDGGGLVTLQVGLTQALANHDEVEDVYLVTRRIVGESDRFSRPVEAIGESGGTLARLEFGGPGYIATRDMWEHRAQLERELRQFLVGNGPFDALHLRFADVGTFVATRLADELGIPVFFTLAPDPHGVIAAAESAGTLTRANFGNVEQTQHYLFRAWLVESMLTGAEHLALLPRRNQSHLFSDLLGVDITASDRFTVIPEGVDSEVSSRARETVENLGQYDRIPPVLEELETRVEQMSPARQKLPLIVTVGRLSAVKGMDRVAAAWASDREIRSRFNLIVVGGNLANPTSEEQAVISAIHDQAGNHEGLVMLGGRTHRDVALILAAAVSGTGGNIGSRGVYVSGSDKEEFGLAIVEALAAGLPVVAPQVGGPATYVDHEFTGFLADTRSVTSIQDGIRWAFDARLSDVRADSARRLIETGYSLSTMAAELVNVYSGRWVESTAS